MSEWEEKTIRTESIYDGNIIQLQVDDVLLPDENISKRELIKHPGAVGIIPITKDNKIVFVKQYRKPLEKALVEIPAGKLEDAEDPQVTARRELEEETGYKAGSLDFVVSFYTSPGFADEIMHLYVTKDIEPLKDALPGDADEFVERVELTLDEAKQYVNEQRIHDAKTNYAILYLERMKEM
ncbi:NUDIX hydrolase [Lentibacillus halophilus]|uniref:NUDIX hydrolase n=1 Tax=Lentibacillus halophilus TaxID=295065 RepID=A0ABN0ZD36_9BACI